MKAPQRQKAIDVSSHSSRDIKTKITTQDKKAFEKIRQIIPRLISHIENTWVYIESIQSYSESEQQNVRVGISKNKYDDGLPYTQIRFWETVSNEYIVIHLCNDFKRLYLSGASCKYNISDYFRDINITRDISSFCSHTNLEEAYVCLKEELLNKISIDLNEFE